MSNSVSLFVEYVDSNGLHQIHDIRLLPPDEIQRIRDAFAILQDFNRGYNLLRFCRINYDEFINRYEDVSAQRGGNSTETDRNIMDLNRTLLNYLSSFRTFNDHHELLFKRISTKDKNHLASFKNTTGVIFDGCFAYRFLWKLRNYVQHCGLPVDGYSTAEDENNPELLKSSIYFDRDTLLKSYDGWGSIKKEILSYPDKIEIRPLVEELDFRIGELGLYVADIHLSRLNSEWEMLNSYIQEAQDHFPNSIPCIGVLEKTGEGLFRLSNYSPFPIHIMRRMEQASGEIVRIQQEQTGSQKL